MKKSKHFKVSPALLRCLNCKTKIRCFWNSDRVGDVTTSVGTCSSDWLPSQWRNQQFPTLMENFERLLLFKCCLYFLFIWGHFETPVGEGKLFENSQQNYFDFSFGCLTSLMIESVIWNTSILVIVFLKECLRMVFAHSTCWRKSW